MLNKVMEKIFRVKYSKKLKKIRKKQRKSYIVLRMSTLPSVPVTLPYGVTAPPSVPTQNTVYPYNNISSNTAQVTTTMPVIPSVPSQVSVPGPSQVSTSPPAVPSVPNQVSTPAPSPVDPSVQEPAPEQPRELPPDEQRCAVTKRFYKPDGRCANVKAEDSQLCEMHNKMNLKKRKAKKAKKDKQNLKSKGQQGQQKLVDISHLSPELQAKIREEQNQQGIDRNAPPEDMLQQWKAAGSGRNVIIRKKLVKGDGDTISTAVVIISLTINGVKGPDKGKVLRQHNFTFEKDFSHEMPETSNFVLEQYHQQCLRKVVNSKFFKSN